MNAKQEIHETLRRCVRYARPLSQSEEDRIRKILDTHTLEPIGDGVPLAQECADLIEEAERRAKENGRRDIAYRNAIQRLKLFLKDRKTSFFAGKEPIDDRPFDPTLCGFARISGHPIWHRNDYSIIVSKIENQTAKQITVKELMGGLVICVAPWPATQSDGERLLKLLGVLK